MKSTILGHMTNIMCLAVLTIPAQSSAQDHKDKLPLASSGEDTRQVQYAMKDLGTLGGALGSSAHSVNDKGWVAGVANLTGDTVEHAALWRGGVVTDLGTLGGDNSNADFPVKNDNGLIVGFAQTSSVDPLGENFCTFACTSSGDACDGSNHSCRGFRWRSGVTEALRTLGGNNSAALGANNRGLVVGIAENNMQDPDCASPQVLDYEAVVWREHAVRELRPVPADLIGAAIAANDNDEIVGATGMCGSGPGIGPIFVHAVLWKNYLPTNLGNLGGAFNNVAYAINNRAQVVGASDLAGDNAAHAFLWQDGLMSDLETLPGDVLSVAFGINDRGQVVGQSCDVNSNCRAFLWQNGVMTDLNTLTAGSGSALSLMVATDINSRAEIVGTGMNQSGEPFAFLAIPCDNEHAEDEGCQESAQTTFGSQRLRIAVPENVREQSQRQSGFRRFGITDANGADILKDSLEIDLASTPNSCIPLGHACSSTEQCCHGSVCGSRRTCCRPFHNEYCTSSAQCCSGACNHNRCE
jgi:probable HAF family extracellular repeat protein